MRPEAVGEYGITGVAEGSVLKDVIAFVEVHSTNANRSKAICRELELLGAKVEAKFTNEVTHVIYKEGTKRTRDKAQKKGVHLISVLWVDSCKQSQQHVSEKLFPANLPDPKTPPLYMAKKKRAKCMQPKAYEDELADMSQRCNKRRIRNLMVEKWKSAHGTPNYTPNSPVILVEDTQPRTPGYSSSAASTPISLTIPNTPPSMQARLDSLKKAKALQAELSAKEGTDEGSSPLRGAVDPLQRRLFQSLLGSSGTADKSSETTVRTEPVTVARTDKIAVPPENAQSDTNNPSKVLVKKNSLKRLLSLKENSPQSFLIGPEQSSEKEPRCSALFANGNNNAKSGKTSKRSGVEDKGKKRKASASYDETNSEKEVTESPAKVRKTGTPVPPKPLPKYLIDGLFESGPCFRRQPRRNSIASPSADILNKETGISKGSASGQTKGRRRTIQQLQEDTSGISDEKVEKHSGCDGNEKESAKSVTMAKPQTKQQDKHPRIQSSKNNSVLASQSASVLSQSSLHGLSMSVAYGNATLSSSQNCSTLAPPRPSIDDFRLHKRRQKNKTSIPQLKETSSASSKDITTSAGSDTRQVEEESGISSGTPGRLSPLKNTSKFRRPKTMKKLPAKKTNKQVSSSGTSSDGERSQTSTKNPSKFARSLVMTSLHTPEQEVVISVVKQLGQFYMTECVKDDTTHVICGEGRRTLNVLHAITHGCWLVSNAWVLRSLEAGKWLDEETYEMEEQFPAAKLARMERQSTAGLYRKTFFSPVGLVYICKKTKPPREHLVSLVQQCGGQVTTCQRKAQVIVGSEFHPDVVSVSPQWILDTISQFKLQAFDSYVTGHPKKQSSPEF